MPLKVARRQGSDNWYLRGTVLGQPVFESTGTDRKEIAEQIRIKREGELLESGVHGKRATATFLEAAVLYLEAGGSPRFIGTFNEETGKWSLLIGHFGERRLGTIGQIDLDRAARLLYPRASAETRNRQLYTPFIAIWHKAVKRGLCDPREWERPKMTARPRSRWATPEEVGRMVDAASPHLAPLVLFLAYTGARMSEALYLDWQDVDLASAWAVFRDTKRKNEDRGVPLRSEIVAELANLSHREGAVFRAPHGGPYRDLNKLGGGQVKTAWHGMLARAGIEGVSPHILRHTFSTWLTAAYVPERIRDELMGHAAASIGRRYAHVPRKEMVEAVAKLPHIPLTRANSEQASGVGKKTAS